MSNPISPRYGFGLAELSSSIFASLGVSGAEDYLNIGPSPFGRECFVLIDGMGADVIARYGELFPIFSELTSLSNLGTYFPSTTAVSLSSVGTGVLPGTHGMLGYTVRVPRSGEPGRLLNSLKWDERVDPVMWQKVPTLFERAQHVGVQVSHIAAKRYEGTGFTQAALRGAKYSGANQISEMLTEAAIAHRSSPSYSYVYINHLDAAGHDEGVGSAKWLEALKIVAELLEGLLQRLPKGTRLWVTADHGMINVEEKIVLGQANPLLEGVSLVGGEPRARHIYLREGSELDALKTWRDFLGERADVFLRDQIISEGYFGLDVSIDSRERMGDLIAIAKGGVILIDPERIKQESSMVGHHGGLDPAEQQIPLLTINL